MNEFKEELVAPCGMNCRICIAFFGYTMSGNKRKMTCPGCKSKDKSCAHLKKYCEKLLKKEVAYCYECNDFPCAPIKRLDTKYRSRFDYSTIENLEYIKKKGMIKFLQKEEDKYKCLNCLGIICVHNNKCYSCETS